MEYFAVRRDVHTSVQVFPRVRIADVVLRQLLSSHHNTCIDRIITTITAITIIIIIIIITTITITIIIICIISSSSVMKLYVEPIISFVLQKK